MEKAKVTMRDWVLTKYNEEYNLSGTADNHPSLGKNVYVSYTSHLVDWKIEEEVLYYETKNTNYICPIKYMNKNPFNHTEDTYLDKQIESLENNELDNLIHAEIDITRNDIKNKYTKHILSIIEEGQKEIKDYFEKEKARLIEKVKDKPDSIYMEVSKIDSGDVAAFNIMIDGKQYIDVVEPYVHTGMFQDSVLYTVPEILDFRYFPGWNGMSSYHWSDTIKHIYLENCMDVPFTFNSERIEPGKIKCCDNEVHREGLFSPDVVNGKNIFSDER